jgi:hypothetical protein
MPPVIVRNLESGIEAVLGDTAITSPLGTRIAASFHGDGLREDFPELHGEVVAGNDFEPVLSAFDAWLAASPDARPDAGDDIQAVSVDRANRR